MVKILRKVVVWYLFSLVLINLLLGWGMNYFGKVMQENWQRLEYSLPNPSVMALKFPFFYFLLALLSSFLLCFSFGEKVSEKFLYNMIIWILLTDLFFLVVSSIGYPLPFLCFFPEIN